DWGTLTACPANHASTIPVPSCTSSSVGTIACRCSPPRRTGVSISIACATPCAPTMSRSSNANPPVFHDVAGFTQTSVGNYQKDALALPAGQFRFEVQQAYTPVFTTNPQ